MNISVTTVAIPMTREHIKRLIDYNRGHGDQTRQSVLNVIRHIQTPVSPHTIKEILDTAAHSKIRHEYEQGAYGRKEYNLKIKEQTIDIRTIHRKLSTLVQEGVIKNQYGTYELTVEARSDIRYFAEEFGDNVLDSLMWMYRPDENSIEQNVDLMIRLFGMYVILCFIETAKPVSPKRDRGRVFPSMKDELVSSCLNNVIRVEKMYVYFLSILDYSLSEDTVKKDKYNMDKIYAELPKLEYLRDKHLKGRPPSALELGVIWRKDWIERIKSIELALRRSIDEIEEDSCIDYPSQKEADPAKLETLSKVLSRAYPEAYQMLESLISGFKTNPKQSIIDLKETWQPIFQVHRSGVI